MTEHILKPLRMPVAFTTTATMRGDIAMAYVGAWDPLRIIASWLVPATRGRLFGARSGRLVEVRSVDLDTAAVGGLVGSVLGFLPFVKAQLDEGRPLLRAETLREMKTLSARGAAGVVARTGTGLGWKIGQIGRTTFLNHEGGGRLHFGNADLSGGGARHCRLHEQMLALQTESCRGAPNLRAGPTDACVRGEGLQLRMRLLAD